MAPLLKEESTITIKGQTTVPKAIRQALGVDYGGRIAFFVDDSRRVYVENADEEVRDPIIERFLDFLAHDMAQHPGTAIVPLPAELRERMAALLGDVDADLGANIDGDVVI